MSSTESHYCRHYHLYDDGTCADCGYDPDVPTPVVSHKSQTSEKVDELITPTEGTKQIPTELYKQLEYLGVINSDSARSHNVGKSDYATKLIQPWSIFLDNPELNYMECDIIKRILRTKSTDSKILDYQKIKHICDELIRIKSLN